MVPADNRCSKEVHAQWKESSPTSSKCAIVLASRLSSPGPRRSTATTLLLIAQKQAIDKKRAHPPIFSPVAVTTLGDFGPGVTTSREWLATRYRRHLSELEDSSGPRPDGQKVEQILARFRDDFNMMLAMAIVRRVGAMAVSSGLPGSCTASYPLPPLAAVPATALLPTPTMFG